MNPYDEVALEEALRIKQQTDQANEGVVGGFIAEVLGLPYVGSVTEIVLEPDGKRARMLQVLERGDRQLMECQLPALLSVEGSFESRPRGARNQFSIRRKP